MSEPRIAPERWAVMSQAEKAAAHPGRHRVRYLSAKDLYVCSKRFCPFSSNNLTYAMSHMTVKDAA